MAAVRTMLDGTPPELVANSMEHAIRLVGGALLKGLGRRSAVKTRTPIHTAEDLLACMACGAGRWLSSCRPRCTVPGSWRTAYAPLALMYKWPEHI
jgi:actin-like ATPase involved in cell morphogenesis